MSRPIFLRHLNHPVLLAVIGFFVTLWCYQPGLMSPDSVEQLRQAREGVLTDWHPPIMSWIWGMFDAFKPGPVGMLVFHNILFWTGLGLWVKFRRNRWSISLPIIWGVGFFPAVFSQLGTIWKDVGMGVAFLLSISCLLAFEKTRSKILILTASLSLFYGICVRYNSILSALPICLWMSIILFRPIFANEKTAYRSLYLAGTGMGIFVFLVVASTQFNSFLTKGKKSFPIQQLLLHDLTAVSVLTQRNLLPDYFRKSGNPSGIDELRQVYSQEGIGPLVCCDRLIPRFSTTDDPIATVQLKEAWIKTIPGHLKQYLSHRLSVFWSLLGVYRSDVCYPFHTGIVENSLGVQFRPNWMHSKVTGIFVSLKDSLVFRGWFYLALSGLAVGIALIRRSLPMMVLASSGLLYIFPYAFIATGCDFRYSWWTALASLLAFADYISWRERSPASCTHRC